MIVRATPDGHFLITQPDHARLAHDLMAAWMNDGLPDHPKRHVILLAVREHDNGWLEEDMAPLVDPQSGAITDFLHSPIEVRQRIWPRAIGRLSSHPYAAALVAQHALSVYEHYRADALWQPFLTSVETLRQRFLAAAFASLDDLLRDYFFVQMGDLISLTFCSDWRDTQHAGRYALRWNGAVLAISPDPFRGASIGMTVAARQLASSKPLTQQDATAHFHTAPSQELTGTARGA